LLLAVVAYVALWVVIPRVSIAACAAPLISKVSSFAPVSASCYVTAAAFALAAVPTIAFMLAQLAIVFFFAKLDLDLRRGLFVFAGCLVGIAIVTAAIVLGPVSRTGRIPTARETAAILGFYYGPLRIVHSLLVMFLATLVGVLVAPRVKDKNLLLPVVIFAAFIDPWTVLYGPVATVLRRAPEITRAVSVPIPHAGTGAFIPSTMIGPGDFLFVALVFAAVHRLKMNESRSFWFVSSAMIAGMLLVAFDVLPYLPALIALAIGVIVAHRKEFKLSRDEKVSVAVVACILTATLPLGWYLLSRCVQPVNLPGRPASTRSAPR
jgi:hypothetical protein